MNMGAAAPAAVPRLSIPHNYIIAPAVIARKEK